MLNTVTTSASALLLALLGGNLGPALPEAGATEPATQDTDTAAVAQESVPADDALADGSFGVIKQDTADPHAEQAK